MGELDKDVNYIYLCNPVLTNLACKMLYQKNVKIFFQNQLPWKKCKQEA